jgi:hypothetical protein
MLRIIIAGLLGGIAMYVWASVAHIATPLGNTGISVIPNEAPVTAALKASLGDKEGLYIYPASNMQGQTAPGPSGILAYTPGQMEMTPATLAAEFAVELVEALIAAVLLSLAALRGYVARVGFVGLVGLAAVMSTNPSYAIWYRFPTSYTLAQMFTDLVGYLVAGLVIAAVLKPRSAAAA